MNTILSSVKYCESQSQCVKETLTRNLGINLFIGLTQSRLEPYGKQELNVRFV